MKKCNNKPIHKINYPNFKLPKGMTPICDDEGYQKQDAYGRYLWRDCKGCLCYTQTGKYEVIYPIASQIIFIPFYLVLGIVKLLLRGFFGIKFQPLSSHGFRLTLFS